MSGRTSSSSEKNEPVQGASTRWTGTEVTGNTDSPSQETDPGQGADVKWTDMGEASRTGTRSPSKKTDRDQGGGYRWTDTGEAVRASFPPQQTEPDQGGRTDRASQIQKVGPLAVFFFIS